MHPVHVDYSEAIHSGKSPKAPRGDFHQACLFQKTMYFWYLTKHELLVHIPLNATTHRRCEEIQGTPVL
jgi:hypothetical protein